VITTAVSWWNQCTGNFTACAQTSPLLILRCAASPGALFGGWSNYTFWDHADVGPLPGDRVLFNGDADAVAAFATTS